MTEQLRNQIDISLDQLKNDTISGAQSLTVKAGTLLSDIIALVPDDMPLSDVHELIVKVCRNFIRVQSSLAPLRHMMKQLIFQIEEPLDVQSFKKNSLAFIDTYLEMLRTIKFRIAAHASLLMANKKTVLTHSLSSLVFETLREAARKGFSFEVLASESRPFLEGRHLVRQLSELGISSTLFVDAAAPGQVAMADIVFLGADRITRSEIINKIGSLAIVLSAYSLHKPCYILAGSDKFLAEEDEEVTMCSGLESEIWEDVPSGVKIVNPYYERIPIRLVTGIVCETGIVPYGQFAEQGGLVNEDLL